jgi:hypothetical protein
MSKIKVTLPKLHPGQRKIDADPTRHRVIAPGRQWGKTTFLTDQGIRALIEGRPAGWYAPTYKRLGEPFRRILKILPPELIRSKNMSDYRIESITGGVLMGWTMEDQDAGRGSTDTLALVDEAGLESNVDQFWHECISPTLARHRGRAVFAGTPKGRNGFWRLGSLGMDPDNRSWSFHAASSGQNPYLPPEYEDEARHDMPEMAFRQEILGEFLEEGGEVIRGLDDVIAAGVTRIEPREDGRYRAGLDLAKSVDYSVLSIFDENGQQVLLERWQGVPWRETIRRAVALVQPYGPTLLVDATGVGDPIYDAIRAEYSRTKPFKFTAQSREDLLDHLVLVAEQAEWRLLDVPAQRAELESLEWKATRMGKLRLQVPDSMHDDIIMANALALMGWRRERKLTIGLA